VDNNLLNYCANKFCPYIIISGFLFYNSGLEVWKSIIILGMCVFIEKFNFKAGYSLAYCESKGIDLDNQKDD
tara:strand:+ start:2990 stop:3205 length:216 start_codon:yes stop_codon:yes gene_type:complete